MQIGSLPKTQECYARIGIGLRVVLRETLFSMWVIDAVDYLGDPLYVAVATAVDWIYDENI